MLERLRVTSRRHDEWIDITQRVRELVARAPSADGVVTVFVPHTTAGVTLQENADPPLKRDITAALERSFPWEGGYGHCEDNAAAHMKAMVTGCSLQIPFAGRELLLGTWQGIYFCEFDGPREREVVVKLSG